MNLDFLNGIFPAIAAMVGFATLLAATINLAKYFGMPDGYAPKVSLWANLALFVFVFYMAATTRLPLLAQIDAEFGKLALFVSVFSTFVTEIGLTKLFHVGLRGVPVIGFSYSNPKG